MTSMKGMTLVEVAVWWAIPIGRGIGAGVFVSGCLPDRAAAKAKQLACALMQAISVGAAEHFLREPYWIPTGQGASDR